ncbi:vitamin B12-dependent ribonucleotide reductase [Aminicella lysinilytica]|uniref:Vitamin B12-dependent ribonucleotide reductase n=1 Tax=Aminicella lysinilytica TaxID=433323 RepID=A0A4R6QE60_9FIRM|nr:vitamin B12-dependent ribonucleotide reductase [Aminicella lysinilytica]TDP60507.1 ribonucleoside-diphosphate reductase class II [Aminicella lysinilytica]
MAISDISENALKVLEKRYQGKDEKGNVVESVEGMFRRVSDTIAKADTKFDNSVDTKKLSDEFFELMTSLRFMPNSPTLMNAGRQLGQLSACFVLPVEDSMEGIFDSVKNAALIHKSGGGTGFSFSRLRQSGASVRSTGGVASGPVSFMRVFNSATEAVKQGGTRRGANMGVLRIDHPDILDFINCKADNADITNFNISVGITEKFMEAVEKQSDYDLIDPKTKTAVGHLSAVKVFDMIVDHAWRNGEPGIIFLDRLNRDNVVPTQGDIESTNPCGEQPLLPYESCNLGSINLVKMLRKTLTGYEFDFRLLGATVEEAVHFLDNVIEVNNYPLDIIGDTTRATRKIGLGVMGWADALLLLGIPYNSDEAVDLAGKVMGYINNTGHAASARLAEKRGAFPLFSVSTYKDGPAMRNATVTTIAPTGTISMIAGCSSGVEPVFAYAYIRNIMDGTEMVEVNPVLVAKLKELGLYEDGLLKKIANAGSVENCLEIPEEVRRVFVSAQDIKPVDHIKMQSAFQRYTDNAVSKTVNFPKEATRNDVREAYLLAYEEDCKGVTIYRDGSREEQVLNIGKVNKKDDAGVAAVADGVPGHVEPRPRPAVTKGFTEKVRIGCGNLYITTNYDENGICEVFTSTGKAGGCPSQSEATARLVSVALRSGISIEEVYDQLKGIRCPSTIRQQGMNCTSCPDAIAKVIMKVSKLIDEEANSGIATSIVKERETLKNMQQAPVMGDVQVPATSGEIHVCPECGGPVEHEGGCVICRNCGFSKCG